MKFNINWSNVAVFMIPTLVTIVGCLFIVWVVQMSEEEIENMNTEARCKTVGGKMGYSKCYKNGKEI
nr:MAG TPA: hypothetical protein [Caudoviricetes sp.]